VTDLIEKIENLRSTLSEVEIIQIIRITYHSFTSSKLHHLRLTNSGKNRTNTYDYFIAKVYDIYNYNLEHPHWCRLSKLNFYVMSSIDNLF
jgi:hypothetical protein